MSAVEAKSKLEVAPDKLEAATRGPQPIPQPMLRRQPFPFLITFVTTMLAAALSWAMWSAYVESPWTRDATVRAYVVNMAPEVAGRIVELPVSDNQFVRKGDLLMVIEPTDYQIAVRLAAAALERADVNAQNVARAAQRRAQLTNLSVTEEEKQNYATNALVAKAQYEQALANLDQARINLGRTQIRAPVNGWVTNLLVRLGDYATVGMNKISVVDADSFWVDGYFEETNLRSIHGGDPARIKLMGYPQVVRGHVSSIARGINVPNSQPNGEGLAQVNPIFTWVRLAQRVPVRVHIDDVPKGVVLVAGITATVQIDPPHEK